MSAYAATTTVPVQQSRNEIERLLMANGATEFVYGSRPGGHVIGFVLGDRRIRYEMPMPDPTDREFTHTRHKNRWSQQPLAASEAKARYEQAVRQRWRALLLIVKAKLEAIRAGVSTIENEFLAWTLIPDGSRTVGEWLGPQIDKAYAGGELPALLPGPTRDDRSTK